MNELKEGIRVIVPAIITGTGEEKTGTITKMENFLHHKFVSIDYDTPDSYGKRGCVVTNTDALHIVSSL